MDYYVLLLLLLLLLDINDFGHFKASRLRKIISSLVGCHPRSRLLIHKIAVVVRVSKRPKTHLRTRPTCLTSEIRRERR